VNAMPDRASDLKLLSEPSIRRWRSPRCGTASWGAAFSACVIISFSSPAAMVDIESVAFSARETSHEQ